MPSGLVIAAVISTSVGRRAAQSRVVDYSFSRARGAAKLSRQNVPGAGEVIGYIERRPHAAAGSARGGGPRGEGGGGSEEKGSVGRGRERSGVGRGEGCDD